MSHRARLSLLVASVAALALLPSGARVSAYTDQYGKWHSPTTHPYTTEDYPPGSRWEPARVCHQGSTEFIYGGQAETTTDEFYTADGPGNPNDHQFWDIVRKFDADIAPMVSRFLSERLLVVRTGDPIDTAVVAHYSDDAHAHYRKNITGCDLLIVWRFVKELGAAGKAVNGGHNKYGRTVVSNIKLDVGAMSGYMNSFYEQEKCPHCCPEDPDAYCELSHVGTLGAYSGVLTTTVHEIWHNIMGTILTTASNKDAKYSVQGYGDGKGPWFFANVISKRPEYWPEATYVRNFYQDHPANYDPATSHFGRQGMYFQNTPRVLEHVRHWTNCPTLKGFPMGADTTSRYPYNYGHYHNVFGTFCDNFAYGGKGCTSSMAWAQLEDSGKWRINWTAVTFQNTNEDLFGGVLPTNDRQGLGTGIPNYLHYPFNDQLQHDIYKETWKRGCGYFDTAWTYQDDAAHPGDVSPVNGLIYHNPKPGYSGFACNGASWNGHRTKRDYCSIDGRSKYICAPHGHRPNGPCEEGNCFGTMEPEVNNFRSAGMIQPPASQRLPGEVDDDGTTGWVKANISTTNLPGSCQYAGSQNQERYGESAHDDSRCFRGSIEPIGEAPRTFTYETAYCFQRRCDANNLIEIEVKGAWYTCPELGGAVEIDGFSGNVTCPHQAIYCPANCPKDADGVECYGRGVCNRNTGICMCVETLVNSSFVGIGCETPWKQFWPSTFDSGYGQFTPLALAFVLPKWDEQGDSRAQALDAVYTSLGVDRDTTEINIQKITFSVQATHFYEGMTLEDWNAASGGSVSSEEWFAGQVSGVSDYSVTGVRHTDVTVSVPVPATRDDGINRRRRSTSRRSLLNAVTGMEVSYRIDLDEMAKARAAQSRNADSGAFAERTASKLGALTMTKTPETVTEIEIQIGTDDTSDMAKITEVTSDRDAFDASLQAEMDERGMFTPEKEEDEIDLVLILACAGSGLFFLLVVVGAAVIVRGRRAKVAAADVGAKGSKGAKAKGSKVAPKTQTKK